MDTKQQHPIDVTDPNTQQACAAIMAAVLRRDPDELRQVWRSLWRAGGRVRSQACRRLRLTSP